MGTGKTEENWHKPWKNKNLSLTKYPVQAELIDLK